MLSISQLIPEYDGAIIYAPSFLLGEQIEADGGIVEGKALGTAAPADLSLMRDMFKTTGLHVKEFANERKKGSKVGLRKMHTVQERTRKNLLRTFRKWDDGELDDKELRVESAKIMRTAWRDVFLAGLRAGGTPGTGAGKGKTLVKLGHGDDAWLKTAMAHESRFLNKFLTAIIEGTTKMPIERRTDMYVTALSSFYESAKVIALPSNILIWWAGPNDKKTCPSCEFMFENGPYTKWNVPTTPRSGATICLTNCRDRLFIRRVDPMEAKEALEGATRTRGGYIKALRQIKRTGEPI